MSSVVHEVACGYGGNVNTRRASGDFPRGGSRRIRSRGRRETAPHLRSLLSRARAFPRALFVIGFLPFYLPAFGSDGTQLQPESTYAVIVGVLEWKGKDLSSFPKENRRDQALYDRLRAMGVPAAQMKLLLDGQATETAMAEAIETIARAAAARSTLVFYYAGHGYPGSRGICLANYDAGVNGTEGFFVDRITELVKRYYRGSRVLLFADCCYSGGLSEVAADLSRQGFASASLTAASIANTSTHQWTFTCNLLDALQGRPLLDGDGDGYISLAEAGSATTEAMAFVERQNSNFTLHGLESAFRLSKVDANAPKPNDVPGPFRLRQFVKVGNSRRNRTARIVDFRDGKVCVEVQRYHDRELGWHSASALLPMERPRLPEANLKRPVALSPEEALKKAHVDGKYADLNRTVLAQYDYLQYGEFHDYGYSEETVYAGEKGISPGHWVYVYPRWYVFGKKQ